MVSNRERQMVDKTGAYGFSWKEWGWFATLFFSFLMQATLVALAYRNMARRISFAIYRINSTSLETLNLVDRVWDDVGFKGEKKEKNRWALWQRK